MAGVCVCLGSLPINCYVWGPRPDGTGVPLPLRPGTSFPLLWMSMGHLGNQSATPS